MTLEELTKFNTTTHLHDAFILRFEQILHSVKSQ